MNIMREGENWLLIDFDALCVMSQEYVGCKLSTAFVPSEVIFVQEYHIGVKSLMNQAKYGDHEFLLAHPSFDVWNLGCILYQLCHPDRQPIFLVGVDDNLSSRNDTFQDSLWLLASWNREIMATRLRDI
jgi:hypothetical protein